MCLLPTRCAWLTLDAIRELWELLERGGLEVIDKGRELVGEEGDDETLCEWSVRRCGSQADDGEELAGS